MVNKVSELPEGRASTPRRSTYGDLLADGVVDPVKVTRSAVLNAASVARMILTTETAVVDKPADAEDDGHGHGHGTTTGATKHPRSPVGPGVFSSVQP